MRINAPLYSIVLRLNTFVDFGLLKKDVSRSKTHSTSFIYKNIVFAYHIVNCNHYYRINQSRKKIVNTVSDKLSVQVLSLFQVSMVHLL